MQAPGQRCLPRRNMYFDLCCGGEFPGPLRVLLTDDGNIRAFVDKVRKVMRLAMAASYEPAPEASFVIRLPVIPGTCELIEDRWEQWLTRDPVRMVDQSEVQKQLKSLKVLFIDCGARDPYNLRALIIVWMCICLLSMKL
jgi:hypothetical protein